MKSHTSCSPSLSRDAPAASLEMLTPSQGGYDHQWQEGVSCRPPPLLRPARLLPRVSRSRAGGALGTRRPRCSWLACPTAPQLPGNRLRLTPSPPQIQPAPRSLLLENGRGEPGQARRRRALQPGWRARSPPEGAGGREQMASLGGGTQRLAPGSLLNSVRTHVSDRRPLGGAVAGTWDH